MTKKIIFLFLLSLHFFCPVSVMADEGMWLPMLLNRNEADMKKNGMRISAQDIYNVNNSSLKDAVLLFGSGCTAEFVSKEGLILTNHHCGYPQIVSHSTLENNYLTNGFWAMNKSEELPCPGLSVTRLVYMEDVSAKILSGITDNMNEQERASKIKENTEKLKAETEKGTHYSARIEPFYYGNQYFMYVNEIFKDVRLVGAPPSNIGKFGGDTDNWMWPRHTGDFAVFRVYTDANNKPAEFSPNNKPYQPKKHLTISLKGANDGDFTFVFGYPGTTQQFLTSYAVDQIVNTINIPIIKLRTERLNIYNKAMEKGAAERLRYASPVARIANGWKKLQGENKGIKSLDGIQRKQNFEAEFTTWANQTAERKATYANLLPSFRKVYQEKQQTDLAFLYAREALFASDIMSRARDHAKLIKLCKDASSEDEIATEVKNRQLEVESYFEKNYAEHRPIDKEIFQSTMRIFYHDFAKQQYPFLAKIVEGKFQGDIDKYSSHVFENSFLTSENKTDKTLKNFKAKNIKKLTEDPAIALFLPILETLIEKDAPSNQQYRNQLDSLYRIYVKGIMEMNPERHFYPDANLTLRVTYGQVKDFLPRDGVRYQTHTSIEGIMQKENPDIFDYKVEPKLKDLYERKDYGRYANQDGTLPVAFIASNHTTGGNSGSPILNADGELLGLNFDRNWEGTMSDIIYDPNRCRNISVDIRYCLFIIEKFAGAKHLVDEMTINQ